MNNPLVAPVNNIVLPIAAELNKLYESERKLRGQQYQIDLKYNESYTFERDFIIRTLCKYPDLGSITSSEIAEFQLKMTQHGGDLVKCSSGAAYDLLELRMISNAQHPLILPAPLYIKKGVTLSIGNLTITDTTFRLMLNGYYPIKDTERNPILFPRPFFLIHRFSNTAPSTSPSPQVIEVEKHEIFTVDRCFVLCIKRDTSLNYLVNQNVDFTVDITIGGEQLFKDAIYWKNFFGTPEYPYYLRPRVTLQGSHITAQISTPAWSDGFNRNIYLVWVGTMQYDLSKG